MNRLSRLIKKPFYLGYTSNEPFKLLTKNYQGSFLSIQIFTLCLFFVSTRNWGLVNTSENTGNLAPPSTFWFIQYIDVEFINQLINYSPVFILLSVVFVRHRWVRILTFALLMFAFAYKNSFGKKLHGEMPWLYCSFFFALIPTWQAGTTKFSRKNQYYHLLLYWCGLFAFLMPYTASGLWKVFYGMIYQPLFDEISFWSLDSMSYMLSFYANRTQEIAPMADFLIRTPIVGYLLLLLGTYWEVIALLPLFRPRHWKFTAVMVLFFHLMSHYTLNITFGYQFLFGGVFLYLIPLHRNSNSWREFIGDFPVFGFLINKILDRLNFGKFLDRPINIGA